MDWDLGFCFGFGFEFEKYFVILLDKKSVK